MDRQRSGIALAPERWHPWERMTVTRIRLRYAISGARNGRPWPPVGVPFMVPESEAGDLIRMGMAEIVEEHAEETATATPKAQTATIPRRKL